MEGHCPCGGCAGLAPFLSWTAERGSHMVDSRLEAPFRRILVATRGAPWSERALELSVRMAKAYQLELVVVAVLTPIYVPQKNAAWGIRAASEVGMDVRQFTQRV